MIFIHAGADFEEHGVIGEIMSADMEVSQATDAELIDNTFSVTVAESVWEADPILEGHHIYALDSEWGGPVTLVRHSTRDRSVTVQGPTWRGLLFQRRIEPGPGDDYLVLTGVDANAAISAAVGDKYGSLVYVDPAASGITVSAQWRYQTVAGGLHSVLRAYGARLAVRFNNVLDRIELSAEAVDSLTDEIEISQDYGVDFTSVTGNVELANHCLALGSGELAGRTVLNVYRYNGQYYTTRPEGLAYEDLRTVILDYPNAEDADDLLQSAIEKLSETAPEQSITVDQLTAEISDVELGDLIGVRDRLTGMAAESEITSKILKITDGNLSIDVKVG